MFDTDTCSYIMKRSHPVLLQRLRLVPVPEVCMSVVTHGELVYGVTVSPDRTQDREALDALLRHVAVVDLTADVSSHYAEIRAGLRSRGAMIGANDLFIAAHARALSLVLVTNNTAGFGRVPDLALENWTLAPRAVEPGPPRGRGTRASRQRPARAGRRRH